MNTEITYISKKFVDDIKDIVNLTRAKAYSAINIAQVESNWLIGKRIVEEEQGGNERAGYGKQIIETASRELTEEFGKGYSQTNLRNFRRFYLEFPTISFQQTTSAISEVQNQQTVSAILSWSHFERIMRIENPKAREWYLKEASEQMWSFRTLNRNINTQYYERLLLTQTNKSVKSNEPALNDKLEFIKNPTVLEFLGLPNNISHIELDIEKAIITHIRDFIMEMGKGFAFVARQQLIRTEAEDYYIDLVFYNYILKCFVLIDLKASKITHQDVGQMDMYIRMYDELKRNEGDNPTIGIVLCSQTDADIARYSILKGNEQLFASKYKLFLPTEDELKYEIEKQREILAIQQSNKDNSESII